MKWLQYISVIEAWLELDFICNSVKLVDTTLWSLNWRCKRAFNIQISWTNSDTQNTCWSCRREFLFGFISDDSSTLFEEECNSNVHRPCRQPRRVVKGMESAQVRRSTWLLANATVHQSKVATRNRPSKRTHFLMVPHPIPKGKLIIDPLMNKNWSWPFITPSATWWGTNTKWSLR